MNRGWVIMSWVSNRPPGESLDKPNVAWLNSCLATLSCCWFTGLLSIGLCSYNLVFIIIFIKKHFMNSVFIRIYYLIFIILGLYSELGSSWEKVLTVCWIGAQFPLEKFLSYGRILIFYYYHQEVIKQISSLNYI